MRLRSSALRHSSSVLSAMRAPPPPPPTLLTRISIPPKAATAASTSRAAWSGCPTSARQDATAMPSARKAASAAASGAAERADSTRRQPSAAKAVAVARPIPRLEPVIRATLSFSFKSIARLRSRGPIKGCDQGGVLNPPQAQHDRRGGGQQTPYRDPLPPFHCPYKAESCLSVHVRHGESVRRGSPYGAAPAGLCSRAACRNSQAD